MALGRLRAGASPWPRASALWKRAETTATGTPASTSRATARTRRAASSHSTRDWKRQRVGAALARVGDRLELHRGLALVVDSRAQAAERRHRVEQPARAGGDRRGDAARAQARATCCHGAARPARRARRERRARSERFGQPRAGHPPRLADRRLAAGHAHRDAVPDALEAAQVADSSSPPQTVPSLAVAGAVEDRARPPAASRRARPGTRPDGRGGAARRRARRRRARARTRVERYSGCRSWATTSGVDREQPLEVVDALAERRSVS